MPAGSGALQDGSESEEFEMARHAGMMQFGFTAALLLSLGAGGAAAQSTLESLPFDKKLKLARAGDDEAQRAVGNAFELGLEGRKINLREAASWYRRAAEQGNAEAQYRLARPPCRGWVGMEQ